MPCPEVQFSGQLADYYVTFAHNIIKSLNFTITFSSIKNIAIDVNSLETSVQNYTGNLLTALWGKEFSQYYHLLCGFLPHLKRCLSALISSSILESDKYEARSAWSRETDSLILKCHQPLRRDLSYFKAKNYFLISRIYPLQSHIKYAPVQRSCVVLTQIFMPLLVSLLTENFTFRPQIMDYAYNYIQPAFRQFLNNGTTNNELQMVVETVVMNIYAKFCSELRTYAGPLSRVYHSRKSWLDFLTYLEKHFYPLTLVSGLACNAYLLRKSRALYLRENKAVFIEISVLAGIDAMLIVALSVPQILHGQDISLGASAAWLCPGVHFSAGFLRTSLALCGIFMVSPINSCCFSGAAPKGLSQRLYFTLKYAAIAALSFALNLFVLFCDCFYERAGIFPACFRIRIGVIGPFYLNLFSSIIYTILPFVLCICKNALLLVWRKANARNREAVEAAKVYLLTVVAVCLRFTLLSLPSVIVVFFRIIQPYLYMSHISLDDKTLFLQLYLQEIANFCVAVNCSVNFCILLCIRKDFRPKGIYV